MSAHAVIVPSTENHDPDDAEYERSVTLARIRHAWGADTAKWPEEERAWLAKEGE